MLETCERENHPCKVSKHGLNRMYSWQLPWMDLILCKPLYLYCSCCVPVAVSHAFYIHED